jgi:hypothetical protein
MVATILGWKNPIYCTQEMDEVVDTLRALVKAYDAA